MSRVRDILLNKSRTEAEARFEAAAKSQYLGNKTVLCRILGGNKFFVFAEDFGLSPHLILDGYWEFWLTKYFARMIRPGDTVIDIGANLGYYSVLAGELVGDSGHVVAVEPNPAVFELLSRNLAVSGLGARSRLCNFALSSSPGERVLPFYVPENEPKNARLVEPGEETEALAQRGRVFDVPLGALKVEEFDRVDFIKIDVEGAELAVLEHLAPIMSAFSPNVVCEVNFGRGYGYEDVQDVLGTSEPLRFLDYDSQIKPLTPRMAAEERIMDDWLLCF